MFWGPHRPIFHYSFIVLIRTSLHTLVQTYRRTLQEQILIVCSARGGRQKTTVEEKQREAERRREHTLDACLIGWQFPW